MPRFIVSLCDVNDHEHSVEIITAPDKCRAAVQHSWLQEIYKESWIEKKLFDDQIEVVQFNFMEQLGWSLVCRNLDSALMNALNDGDSNVSSSTQQD